MNPSWIRIKDEGRKVVVEKILKAGEVLEIKNNWFNGNLRAGNAKDLFFSLNGVTYGPVSDKRKVINFCGSDGLVSDTYATNLCHCGERMTIMICCWSVTTLL